MAIETGKNSKSYYGDGRRNAEVLEQQRSFSQQIATQNQKINQVMDQIKEIEKQKGSTEIPNFMLVNEAETGEIGHSGNSSEGTEREHYAF